MKFEWKQIIFSGDSIQGNQTTRLKVIDGWIVRHTSWNYDVDMRNESMVFVPDLNHKWEID